MCQTRSESQDNDLEECQTSRISLAFADLADEVRSSNRLNLIDRNLLFISEMRE